MVLSAVHNLEICTASSGIWSIFSRKYFSTWYTPRYCEHLWKHSFTDRWSLEWEIEQSTFAGGNWSTWSILALGSSVYFGSIYCEHSPHFQVQYPLDTLVTAKHVFRMFVRWVLLVYSEFCILLVMFPALAVFGPSVLQVCTGSSIHCHKWI